MIILLLVNNHHSHHMSLADCLLFGGQLSLKLLHSIPLA